MYHKLTTIFTQRVHPYVLLACGLILLVLLTGLTGMWHYRYELDHLSGPPPVVAMGYAKTSAKTASLQQAGAQGAAAESGQAGGTGASQSDAAAASQAVSSAAQAENASPAAAGGVSSSAAANVAVSLSVNGSYKGQVALPGSSNQCEVLSSALQEGVIGSLDMRYNTQYRTYGVYVIDGIGDSDSVWWTYVVNGKSPPLGCSHTAVHSGDSVNWQYIKG